MRAVNLLPRREASKKALAFNSELAAAIGFTVIVVVAVLGGFFVEKSHAATEKQKLAAAQAALALASSQQTSGHPMLQTPDVLAQQEPWHLALDSALSTRVSWDVLLSQLEYVVPDKVSLTTVSFGSADGATGATTATLSLGGSAYSLHDIGVFLSTLARIPKVSQVTLVSAGANAGSNVVTFQITAQVTLPAADAAPITPTATPMTTPGGQA